MDVIVQYLQDGLVIGVVSLLLLTWLVLDWLFLSHPPTRNEKEPEDIGDAWWNAPK